MTDLSRCGGSTSSMLGSQKSAESEPRLKNIQARVESLDEAQDDVYDWVGRFEEDAGVRFE